MNSGKPQPTGESTQSRASAQLRRATAKAQQLAQRSDKSRVAVEKLLVSGRATQPRSGPWLPISLAWAAAATVLLLFVSFGSFGTKVPPKTEDAAPAVVTPFQHAVTPPAAAKGQTMGLGHRVALVSSGGSRFDVVAQQPGMTRVVVQSGTVAVRLFHGSTTHRLEVAASNLIASAAGTCYSVGVVEGKPSVTVYQGKVLVQQDGQQQTVLPGQSWQEGKLHDKELTTFGKAQLLAMPVPEPAAWPEQITPESAPAPVNPEVAQSQPARNIEAAKPLDLWRQARLLRGQGRYQKAVALLQRLVKTRDPKWAPLALIELARLSDQVLGKPKEVIAYCEHYFADYSGHTLEPEATALFCRAKANLGQRSQRCEDFER